MSLAPRLFNPAKAIFEVINAEGIDAILMGGAAVILNEQRTNMQQMDEERMKKRQTDDLDINVTSLDFRRRLHADQWETSDGSSEGRLKATYLHPTEAVRCDIATRTTLQPLLQHTKLLEGIRYANCSLLLADKIVTFTERQSHSKQSQDYSDVLSLCSMMEKDGETMPEDLKRMFLEEGVIERFMVAAKGSDVETTQLFLQAVGIGARMYFYQIVILSEYITE